MPSTASSVGAEIAVAELGAGVLPALGGAEGAGADSESLVLSSDVPVAFLEGLLPDFELADDEFDGAGGAAVQAARSVINIDAPTCKTTRSSFMSARTAASVPDVADR